MDYMPRQGGWLQRPGVRWALVAVVVAVIGLGVAVPAALRALTPKKSVAGTPTMTAVAKPPTATATAVVPAGTQWFFAEGSTAPNFTTQLALVNPNPTTAHITAQYLLASDTPAAPLVKTFTVPANARITRTINSDVGAGKTFSIVLTSDIKIVAERATYFTYTVGGTTIRSGTGLLGATTLSSTFDFGYLETTAAHASFLTVLNLNSYGVDAHIRYFSTKGAEYDQTQAVPANARATVAVNGAQVTTNGSASQLLPAGQYFALVSLAQSGTTTPAQGLVERRVYLKDGSTGWTGAADVIGVAAPAPTWYFGGGHTSGNFKQVYIVSNPGTTPANAKVTVYKQDGSNVSATLALAPGQQSSVFVSTLPGMAHVDMGTSAIVTSDQPVLAERYLNFRYTYVTGGNCCSNIPGLSDVMGTTTPGHTFIFADGSTGPNFMQFMQLLNPSPSQTATMVVTFLSANGAPPKTATFRVPPHSRYSVISFNYMHLQAFGVTVQSDVPLVVERGAFFAFDGTMTGGSNVIGYQPPGS